MKKTLAGMLVWMLVGGIASAVTNNLDTLRLAYTLEQAKIDTGIQQKKKDTLAQYGKVLADGLKVFKQKGDIDGYKIVETEINRFGSEKTIPTNYPPLLNGTVVFCQKQFAAADAEALRLKAELLRRYIFALNSLVKELMAQNKIDEAKAARDVGNAVGATLAALETSTSTVSTQGAESSRRPVPGFAREFRKHHYLLVKKATTTRVQRSAENKPTEAAFTWTKAQEACEKMGGHLVKVNDAEAFEFVRSLAEMEKGNRVWIGLRRLEDDGKFTWVDGSDVLYKGWGGWQPKKGPAMKFVSMGKGWEHKIGWDVGFDSDGDVTGYVCEWDY